VHYFITGHTGFKGGWLILLLRSLGHEVSGYSLPAAEGSLFERAGLENELLNHFEGDIRNLKALKAAVAKSAPHFAIHMAAQSLVLRSYEDPIETYSTNVGGTRNFLQAISEVENPPISLVITTDKVYRDEGKDAYIESDPLGGHDPYSASKAMADILTQSWAATNQELRLHVARAGNVIGAFDVSADRILPDALRALAANRPLIVRSPNAVRPWQHVLDCLSGYISFLDRAAAGVELPTALNFGPDSQSIRTVGDLLLEVKKSLPDLEVQYESSPAKEAQLLSLNSARSFELLGWKNRIGFTDAVNWAITMAQSSNPPTDAKNQVANFLELEG
jgi:CDP-glucose 4,6-dehydratase|tara:strand:- start:6194 stop:7195 length:1002 start_codon:yes stop_codon:yes gene_type:complete